MKKVFIMIFIGLVFFALSGCSGKKSKEYYIKIIVNDDNNTIVEKKIKHGDLLKELNEQYVKKTFEFKGWLLDGEPFEFGHQVYSDLTIEGFWQPDGIRRGTFDREYPSYYELGVPLIDDAHVVYINLDGFARYYYDESLRRDPNSLPNIRSFFQDGVFFEDLRNAAPSITNPCQNMIISGATSVKTQNVYRYYDRKTNTVIQQQRENKVETIVDRVVDAGLSVASVSFYLAEPRLSATDPTKLYVYQDNTNPKVVARGEEKYGDYFSRFEQAIKLVKGEPIKTSGNIITVTELPKFIMIYADDLDALGHNDREGSGVYGFPNSLSEYERMDKMVQALINIDEKLGEFIEATKEVGVYDKMTFILTTDHGMTPFGSISGDEGGKYAYSKIADLKYALNEFDNKFELEKVEPEEKPNSRTNVVGVGMNLNLQLTFLEEISDERLEELKEHLLKEYYVGIVKTRKELEEEGYWTYAADMIITPAERYNFAPNPLSQYRVRGQHDSYLDSSNHVFGIVFGKGIKKGVIFEERAYNYDFGITMAAIFGLDLPKANGVVLDIFEKEDKGIE